MAAPAIEHLPRMDLRKLSRLGLFRNGRWVGDGFAVVAGEKALTVEFDGGTQRIGLVAVPMRFGGSRRFFRDSVATAGRNSEILVLHNGTWASPRVHRLPYRSQQLTPGLPRVWWALARLEERVRAPESSSAGLKRNRGAAFMRRLARLTAREAALRGSLPLDAQPLEVMLADMCHFQAQGEFLSREGFEDQSDTAREKASDLAVAALPYCHKKRRLVKVPT